MISCSRYVLVKKLYSWNLNPRLSPECHLLPFHMGSKLNEIVLDCSGNFALFSKDSFLGRGELVFSPFKCIDWYLDSKVYFLKLLLVRLLIT